MRTKSRIEKTAICLRLKTKTLEEIDKIAQAKNEDRSELIRKILENFVFNFSA